MPSARSFLTRSLLALPATPPAIRRFSWTKSGDQYFEQPFWSTALTGKDALRKRVQFALSELFVISSQDAIVGQMPRGVANYYDMLGNDAFTNYRQILQDVTLNPMMGIYLSILANDKGDANRGS